VKKVPDTSKTDPAFVLLDAMARGGAGPMIQAQEARGQQDAVNSDQLPTRGLLGADRPVWEAMGIKIRDDLPTKDSLFTFVELPKGWKKVATDHSMWNNVVDNKGRVRASFFYKAAFYDRDANIHPVRRFTIERNYERKDTDDLIEMQVRDAKKAVFSVEAPMPKKDGRRDYSASEEVEKELRAKCAQWLVDNGYPDYNSCTAYWD